MSERTIPVTEPVTDTVTQFLAANGLNPANIVAADGIRVDDQFVTITVYLTGPDGEKLADGTGFETTGQFNPILKHPEDFGL